MRFSFGVLLLPSLLFSVWGYSNHSTAGLSSLCQTVPHPGPNGTPQSSIWTSTVASPVDHLGLQQAQGPSLSQFASGHGGSSGSLRLVLYLWAVCQEECSLLPRVCLSGHLWWHSNGSSWCLGELAPSATQRQWQEEEEEAEIANSMRTSARISCQRRRRSSKHYWRVGTLCQTTYNRCCLLRWKPMLPLVRKPSTSRFRRRPTRASSWSI